jgi:hypothetical protein
MISTVGDTWYPLYVTYDIHCRWHMMSTVGDTYPLYVTYDIHCRWHMISTVGDKWYPRLLLKSWLKVVVKLSIITKLGITWNHKILCSLDSGDCLLVLFGMLRWWSEVYRVIQEESAVLSEMRVCVIASKKVNMNMGLILNGYRDNITTNITCIVIRRVNHQVLLMRKTVSERL